jgi:hypothetical protein
MTSSDSGTSSPSIRRLVIADPGLSSRMGHHYNYVHAVVEAARRRGLEVLVLCPFMVDPSIVEEFSAVPVFRVATYTPLAMDYTPPPDADPAVIWGQQVLMSNAYTFGDLLVRATPLCRPDDLVFFHTVRETQLIAIAQWLASFPADQRPQTNILLRFWMNKPFHQPLFELCATLLNSPAMRVRYSTDTAELSALYSNILKRPVDLVPIPMPIPYESLTPERRAGRRRFLPPDLPPDTIVIGYTGDCRLQKGFHYLKPVIANMEQNPPEGRRYHFLIQVSDVNFSPEMRGTVHGLAPEAGENVTVVWETLSADDYYSLFTEIDIMVVHYDPKDYAYTSSGLLTEAALLGKVSVVPAGTSIEREAARLGTGHVPIAGFHAVALDAALRRALAEYPVLAGRSRAAMPAARSYHSTDTLVSYLLGET